MLEEKRIIHEKDIIYIICGAFNGLLMQSLHNNESYVEASEKFSFAAFSILLYLTILFPKHRLTTLQLLSLPCYYRHTSFSLI